MRCPFCSFDDTQVKDSRPFDDNQIIKRKRQCPSCGARFKTCERIEIKTIRVIKRNGEIKDFDYNKILKSIEIAGRKRKLSSEAIDSIVNRIITKIEKFTEEEISTEIIGGLVMSELAKVDHVAYIRYASVYRDFSEISDFARIIEKINKNEDV